MEFFRHAESWVLVSFILFLAVLVYLKVPAMVGKMLDERADKIASELDSARKLRVEAEALLAEYKQKRRDAEKEAQGIIAQAKSDAEEYAAETRRKLSELLDRRSAQAEQKIAQAETSAIKEVRNAVTDLAIAAARDQLAEAAKGTKGGELIANSIETVKTRLN